MNNRALSHLASIHTGGNTLFPQFKERLERDLGESVSVSSNILAPPARERARVWAMGERMAVVDGLDCDVLRPAPCLHMRMTQCVVHLCLVHGTGVHGTVSTAFGHEGEDYLASGDDRAPIQCLDRRLHSCVFGLISTVRLFLCFFFVCVCLSRICASVDAACSGSVVEDRLGAYIIHIDLMCILLS